MFSLFSQCVFHQHLLLSLPSTQPSSKFPIDKFPQISARGFPTSIYPIPEIPSFSRSSALCLSTRDIKTTLSTRGESLLLYCMAKDFPIIFIIEYLTLGITPFDDFSPLLAKIHPFYPTLNSKCIAEMYALFSHNNIFYYIKFETATTFLYTNS